MFRHRVGAPEPRPFRAGASPVGAIMETNVHRGDCLREDCARVLGVAALLWGSVVAIAAFEGALAKFEGSTLAMLTLFVSLYAAAVYFLDAELRAYAGRIGAMR